MQIRTCIVCLAVGMWAHAAGVAVAGADSYLELFRLAKKYDSVIVQAEARLAAARAESGITLSGLYPRVDANIGVNQIGQTIQNYGPTTQHGSVLGYSYGVAARVNLLHIPTLMNLGAVDAGIRREEAGVRLARQDLIVRFADAYFGLLKAQEDHAIARKELERIKQVLEQSQAFFQAGTGDIIAVHEARARFDSVAADLNRFETNLRLAEQKLSALVGKQVKEVQDYAPLVAVGPQPDDLSHWLTTMERHDPLIRQGIETLDRSSKELKAVKAEHYPSVQATGGYTSSKGSVFLPEVETQQWYLGMSVSIPLYSGGETSARVQRAVAFEAERKGYLDDIRRQRSENLKQAYYNLAYNVALLKSLEQRLSSAETQLTAVRKGRAIGTRSAIDVLNAEQAYSVALRDHRNTLYDNVLKNILLKNAAGVLDDDNQVPMLQGRETALASVPSREPVRQASIGRSVGASTGVVLMTAETEPVPLFHEDAERKRQRRQPCSILPVALQAPASQGAGQGVALVMESRENRIRVACSSIDDTAWTDLRQGWRYMTWKEFWRGRKVRILPGLPQEQYAVYDSAEKEIVAMATPDIPFDLESVIESWALVRLGNGQTGWMRWKDSAGRLLIATDQ